MTDNLNGEKVNYKLTITSDKSDELLDALRGEDWRLAVRVILNDLRNGYKYGDLGWLPGFDMAGVTSSDAEIMCGLIAEHVSAVFLDYGLSADD